MTAIANMTLTDGMPTPVARVFSPSGIDASGVASWHNRAGGIAIGYDVLSGSLRAPLPKGQRVYKAQLKLRLPTLEVTAPSTASGIQPAPTVAYEHMVNVEFVLPERGSAQERENLRVMLIDALGEAPFVALIEALEPVY